MIHFVGAGCGAEDLITVRGARLLEEADVIIYAGSLVNPRLLAYAKEGARICNSAHMHLEEVLAVMYEAEKNGLDTVRLQTGDPSLYGALREQLDALRERNISYDITPGVSSFCGAAAALEAEYTLPGVSQTLIITRMAGRTPVPESESLAMLARHNASMAIFLSAGMIDKAAEELEKGGMSARTPAAVVYKATWDDQKIVRGTLADIAEKTRAEGISKTALIAVGNFLGDDYALSKLYDKAFSTGFREATV